MACTIASAFAAEPKLIIADEPTTALDVTVQKQILRLINEMQTRHDTALLFVTHDLGVVSKVCDTLSVLYAGKVVEDAQFVADLTHPQSALPRVMLNPFEGFQPQTTGQGFQPETGDNDEWHYNP